MTMVPEPLGCFGRTVGEDPESIATYRAELVSLVGKLAADPAAVAAYLRSGSIVIAIMGYSYDLIDGRHLDLRQPRHRGDRRNGISTPFGVAGGPAIQTDGAYYWRRETADYVEHYHIGLPAAFVDRMRLLDWVTPALDEDHVRAIDRALRSGMQPELR